jgi:chromosome segregation ATPase
LAETLKSLQIDLENHKYEKISKSDELCRVSVQNENSLYEIDKLKYFYRTTCDEIIKTIDLFFPGQFQKNSVEFFFDDYLITWVRKLNEEIENTLKKYTDQHKLLVCTQQANKTLSSNLETISQECNQLKSKEIQHRNQIENQLEEINYIKESFKTQIASFQQEIISLRQDLKSLHEENESTTDKSRKQSAEIMNLKYKLSSSELDRLALEEKYSLIKNEKSNIASLVKKIQHLIISPQFQRLINEILRVHSELEFSQLEKLRVSMQLRNPDEITDQSLLETLRKQFSLCESNIISYLNKLQSLEDQLIHEKSFIST